MILDFATMTTTLVPAVENNGCLAVKPKSIKLTYAETVRVKKTVEAQNLTIRNGGDPFNQ